MLGLMAGVVCIVEVFGQSRCRGLPKRMLVDIECNLWCVCYCMFVLLAVVEEVLVLVVVCCLQLLKMVLLLSAVVVEVLAGLLRKC